MRLIVAIQAFFAILFGGKLPPAALPAPEEPERPAPQPPPQDPVRSGGSERLARVVQELEATRQHAQAAKGQLEGVKEEKKAVEGKLRDARDHGALALITWFQREGRLIDFLMEDIDPHGDADIGAAVRAIHKGCRRVLEQALGPAAILEGEEQTEVEVPEGFDPVAIQLSGKVKGSPPFKGLLMHHGWRSTRVAVPVAETVDPEILAPAEVEL